MSTLIVNKYIWKTTLFFDFKSKKTYADKKLKVILFLASQVETLEEVKLSELIQ